MGSEMAVEVSGLTKRYGETIAVDDLTLSVRRGEIFGLLGPNGAGKTTTIECLLGMRQPDEGNIRILGMTHSEDSRAIRTRLGVQLQTTGMLSRLKVREQVELFTGLFPHTLPAKEIIELVGLEDKISERTNSLSGGQKQRLAIGLALINDPDLIILDEPTTGLDPQARRSLWEVIKSLQARQKTILLSTHYMEEAEQLCDRVAILDRGAVIELDTPESLINRHFAETAIEFVARNKVPLDTLSTLPSVGNVIVDNGRTTLYSTDVPHTMARLFDLVSAGTVSFKDMTIRQATLEDVFLKLTGRRIRA